MDFSSFLAPVNEFLDRHALFEWTYFILLLVLFYSLLRFIQTLVEKRLNRFTSSAHAIAIWKQLHQATTRLFLMGIALFFCIRFVSLSPQIEALILKIAMIIFWIQMALWLNRVVSYGTDIYVNKRRVEDPSILTVARMASFVLRLLGVFLIVIIALDNVGFDVTTLIASLGIGGIAVALAVQNILGDLLASLSITLDKPFVVGDFIVMDSFMGTVEYIGIKTTRVRSLGGEQIIFSNAELLSSRIRNFKRMYERRVVFTFTIRYDTAEDTLAKIPLQVKNSISSIAQTRFDRCHLFQFGELGFVYEAVYYVLVPDYNQYMDIQQTINLELIKTVHTMGTEFASVLQIQDNRVAAARLSGLRKST